MTLIAPVSRLASDRVRTRLTTRTWFGIAPTLSIVLSIALAACGSGRNYDNPPEISPITAGSSTSTTSATTTTVFVPTTAPTTLGPVTEPPTAPPPPPPPPTAPPTPPPTPPPPPTTPPPTTGETYVVVGGDTLFGISRKLGVTLDALLAANNLTASSLITPGQRLQIPVGGSVPATNAPTNPPATNATGDEPAGDEPAGHQRAGHEPARHNAPGTSPATSPQNQPTTTFAAPPGAVQPTGASATCQAPDSQEANGTPIVFAPGNVLDRNPASAWRCAAPATGQSLTVTLAEATHLTSVGMIGGYDKKDPLTGIDRWPQNHRVRRVRWTFSDGTVVEQDLADARGMQSIDVDVTTTSVKIEILSTYPPSGQDPKQMVVVAEVQLIGG